MVKEGVLAVKVDFVSELESRYHHDASCFQTMYPVLLLVEFVKRAFCFHSFI